MTVAYPAAAHGRTATLRFPTAEAHIARIVRRSGTYYERELLDAVRDLQLGGTYVDVGAHVGNHALFFALSCPSRRVVAIEPEPKNYALLRANTKSVDKIRVLQAAAMSRRGQVACDKPSAAQSGMTRVAWSDDANVLGAPLDDLVRAGDVTFVKIDVEGAELEVLLGASRILDRAPVLAVEALTPAADIHTARLLRARGYRRGPRYGGSPSFIWWPRKEHP